MGFFLNISAITQLEKVVSARFATPLEGSTHPTPHMSTCVWYFWSPRSSSGGRYQRVTTQFVYSCDEPA